MVEGGRSPILTVDELEKLGFSIVIFSTGPLYSAAKGLKDYLTTLKIKKTTLSRISDMISFSEFNELIGLQDYLDLEKKYQVE
jgi:2-methylisocitrate lyase-like PEP mutase family enzyme